MKILKKLMVVLLTVIMIMPLTASAATVSPSKKDLKDATATAQSVTYNGKKQEAKLTVKMGEDTLVEGEDFVISGSNKRKNVGTYTLTIYGIGKYSGTQTVTFSVKKATRKDKVTVTGKALKNNAKVYKTSTLEKKTRSFRVNFKTKAKVTYTSPSKSITVSKNGKVTVKKGTAAGTYKVYVKVAATKNYKAFTKVIKIKVK